MNIQNNIIRIKAKGIQLKNDEIVKVQIPLKNGELWEKEYYQKDKIENIINDFKQQTNEDIPEDYISDWKTKNQLLNMNSEIKSLITKEIPNLFLSNNLNSQNKPIQTEQPIIPNYIAKPFSNPFELFIFRKKDKILKIQKYPEEIIQNNNLNNFNISSAYCNGNNNLFISGGETEYSEKILTFWIIELENQEISTIPMPLWKKNHSMVYLPNNYVFFVGGNDLKTFYYDIKMNEFISWVDLNKKRIEPALALVNNYLYCFENTNLYLNSNSNTDKFTIEKTDITSENPTWIFIKPNINLLFGNQKFFGVINNGNNIIFIGGNMDSEDNFMQGDDNNNKFNLKYDINLNIIEPSDIPFKDYYLKEKTFLPFNENIDYILPDFNRFHPEVLFYQKTKNKLSLVKYESFRGDNISNIYNKSYHDYKYDLNMPRLTLLKNEKKMKNDEENINDEDNDNNENNEVINMKIKEPSFIDINYDNYNVKNIKQNPKFKPPEINANNPDVKISLNIPTLNEESKKDINNVVENKENIYTNSNKKEIEFNINLPYDYKKIEKNKEDEKNIINNNDINEINDHTNDINIKIENQIENINENINENVLNKNINLKGNNNKDINQNINNKEKTPQEKQNLPKVENNNNINKDNKIQNNKDNNQNFFMSGIILGVKDNNLNTNKIYANKNTSQVKKNNNYNITNGKNGRNNQSNMRNKNNYPPRTNNHNNNSYYQNRNMNHIKMQRSPQRNISPTNNKNVNKISNSGKNMNALKIDFTKNVDIHGVIPGIKRNHRNQIKNNSQNTIDTNKSNTKQNKINNSNNINIPNLSIPNKNNSNQNMGMIANKNKDNQNLGKSNGGGVFEDTNKTLNAKDNKMNDINIKVPENQKNENLIDVNVNNSYKLNKQNANNNIELTLGNENNLINYNPIKKGVEMNNENN